ncbi:phage protein NinX family protein [Hydrogenophaga sp. 2FB]|uniref:phage protein NinX family protein n=1 Tax=Hydrogenophaga sp. 2FB TaxID=2502187 RepID=UPI001484E57C|nr:phage protein NinX family protein [Hydrogenophaga sp. 2FB]
MITIKVSELTGVALDWAVAKAVNLRAEIGMNHTMTGPVVLDAELHEMGVDSGVEFKPSTDWAQGGPILDRLYDQGLQLIRTDWPEPENKFRASMHNLEGYFFGSTPRIAALRCLVASNLGVEIQVPVELMRGVGSITKPENPRSDSAPQETPQSPATTKVARRKGP